jgi:hypothetical protein
MRSGAVKRPERCRAWEVGRDFEEDRRSLTLRRQR